MASIFHKSDKAFVGAFFVATFDVAHYGATAENKWQRESVYFGHISQAEGFRDELYEEFPEEEFYICCVEDIDKLEEDV